MSKQLSTAAIAALNEVLLQAALRGERAKSEVSCNQRASMLAQRLDQQARDEKETA